jgi:pSer/pThr/pTyr-binding forkhead associated (FHA) protein
MLTDLDSTNGTFVNDSAEGVARIELKDNDIIRLGETTLKFKCL